MVDRHLDNVTAARGRVRRVLSQRARQSGKRGEHTPQRSLIGVLDELNDQTRVITVLTLLRF